MNQALKILEKANQEANETRIKLATLRACYINLAGAFHEFGMLIDKSAHVSKNWRECDSPGCKSNYDVLVRLGLV